MYPRFIQVFLNKQLEGVKKPKQFLPTIAIPSKVFTFMKKNSDKFSGTVTHLNAHMLTVTASVVPNEPPATSTEEEPTKEAHSSPLRTPSPNDLTPTDKGQTFGGDEGDVTLSRLTHDVKRLTKKNSQQAKQILLLKTKIKKLFKMVKPVVTHHRLWIKSQKGIKKKDGKKAKKKSSSKQGRKSSKDIGGLDKDVDGVEWAQRIHPNEDINWEATFDDFQKQNQEK